MQDKMSLKHSRRKGGKIKMPAQNFEENIKGIPWI